MTDCTICGHPLGEALFCIPCDAADAAIRHGECHPDNHEFLAHEIGKALLRHNWKRSQKNKLRDVFPTY